MAHVQQRFDVEEGPPPARRPRSTATITALVLLVLALGCVAALAVGQQRRLTATRASLAAVRAAQDADHRALSALSSTLAAQRQQLTGLATSLQAAQTRLKADEQQLNVTTGKLPPDLVSLATKVSPSVVLVSCTGTAGVSTGTGFALAIPSTGSGQTSIVTAEHVVESCTTAGTTLTVDHGTTVLPAHLRSYDRTNDVAIIDTTTRLPALHPATAPVVGEFVMAVGNPLGLANNVTSGNVSQVSADTFLHSAPVSNGNSGGPLVDRTGAVVGIVDAGYAPSANAPVVQNLNIALPLSSLCKTLLSGTVCQTLH